VNFRAFPLLIAGLVAVHGGLDATAARAQENALPEVRAAAKAAPTDLAAQTALGHALIEAGRLREAEAQMKTVVRLSQGSVEGLYEAMKVKFAADEYRQARAGCRELTKKNPNHVLTHVCMARAFLVWRRASRAFEHIDKALAVDPGNYEAQLAEADAKRMQGDFAAAKASYERALQTRATADAYLGLAVVHEVQNHGAEALAALRKAQTLDPKDPDVQLQLGRRLKGAEAVSLLRAALAGRPQWPEAELALAIAQLQAGDAAGAEKALAAVLKRSPGNPIAVAQHAAALVALGRYAEAEPALKRALELIPNDYDAALALAKLYEHTGRPEDAFVQYRAAGDLKRESPEALLAAGRLALSLKRPVLAIGWLEKALERTPRSAEVLALLAEAWAARGDKKAAREHLQKALAGEGPLDKAAAKKRLAELQ
jgi:tetratricopeptide (TPR) repeat protein